MRRVVAILVGTLALTGVAAAQTPVGTFPTESNRGYVEAVVQSAFGNVTSQSFGGEIGVTARPGVQLVLEAGLIRDAAPAALGASAQRIAAGITAVAGSADFRVRQPVTFGLAGVKFLVPVSGGKLEPYVLVAGGAARVKRDVTFSTQAGDVNQFVALGTDLSGSETKGMLSLGAGIGLPVWQRLIIDLQYRYGRVFMSGEALNASRAGVGIGVRF